MGVLSTKKTGVGVVQVWTCGVFIPWLPAIQPQIHESPNTITVAYRVYGALESLHSHSVNTCDSGFGASEMYMLI